MRFLVGFFLFLSILSCNKLERNNDLKIFRYNESSGIFSLDPIYAKDQATIWAVNQLFNGLVQLDSNLNVIPSIAKKWHISNDGLSYTFLLRDDVYFHDNLFFKNGTGRRVLASDFEYSFDRLIDKDIASPGGWVLRNVSSYKAINDSVFAIDLISPFPAFLSLLSMQYCSVVPKEVVENSDFNISPIGTGPFKFQLWKKGVKLIYRKNDKYFEKDSLTNLPYLDGVAITFIKDKQSTFLQFILGNIDFISGIDPSYKDEVLTTQGKLNKKYSNKINLTSNSYLNTEYLGFNMTGNYPLKLRQAINYGFDRHKMLKYLRNNIGTPANQGFIPRGIPSFCESINGYYYDPNKAKQLLIESGYNINDDIVLSTTSSYLDLCEYIQHELSKIGLKIKIEVNIPSTHRQLVANNRLAFFRGSWIADYPDAENYLALFYSYNHTPNGPNYTHFNNKLFDELYEKSLSEINDSIRFIYYKRMDQIIIDHAPIVPLYYDKVLRFTQKNIQGLGTNGMNLLDLKRVRK